MMRGPKVGHTIAGRYRIQKRIGRGGFGAVYIAHDRRLNRAVALKCNLFGDVEGVAQFVVEARILAGLSHPALPTVYGRHDEILVMEYIPGQNLQAIAERGGPLPVTEALHAIHQIGGAVAYLHENHVVHRDIKPANIIQRKNGQYALVDFGLSKRGSDKTRAGASATSAGYSPPEQYVKHGEGTDPRSDIYALGATLYYLLTGKEPIESTRRMLGDRLSPPHKVRTVPRPVSAAIMHAMHLDPSDRFNTIDGFLVALGRPVDYATTIRAKTRQTPPPDAPIQVSQTKKRVTVKTARPVVVAVAVTGRKKRKRRKRRPVDWGFWWMVVQAVIYYLGIGGLALLIMMYIALAMTGYDF